jgi:AcrR family transcriptional regulator
VNPHESARYINESRGPLYSDAHGEGLNRSDRILRAVRELVLTVGYPKVNVQDIANAANVGKGTIYLHWDSKDEILDEMLLHEHEQISHQLITRVRREHQRVTLSALGELLYSDVMNNAILRAYNMGDTRMLGRSAAVLGAPDRLGISLVSILTRVEYLEMLRNHGLVVTDACSLGGRLAIGAVVSGFVVRSDAATNPVRHDSCARLLAAVLHRSFEPADCPTSSQLRAALHQLRGEHPKWCAERRTRVLSKSIVKQ